MVQRIEAWGNVLEFPDDMPDADIASAIQKNEANLNPDASTFTKVKSAVSGGIDAGLSMLAPKHSIADQAQEQSASTAGLSAPQVKGLPVRRDFYNRMVENPVENAAPGVVSRVRDNAANDPAAKQRELTAARALVSAEPVPEEGGFINSAGRTIGQNIKGAGQAAADFIPGVGQDNAVKRFGQDVIDANPTAVNSLEDIADKPGTAVTEATGNAVPSMAGMVGARALGQGITALSPLAGPAAPVVAAVGQVVSWLGPAAIAALPSYGGIRDKQIIDDPKNEESAKAKAIAALGAGAVGAIEQAFGPQQWALAALTKEGRVQLAKKFAATSLPGAIGKGVVKGATIEGAEELAQNPIEQLAAFDNPTTAENLEETAFGGAMGAIGGGLLGGGVSTIAGKPVTEHSDNVLKYTAARGSERAKAAAQAELNRRAAQGVDPAVANAPESTSEAVDRIISTGKDKAQEIRDSLTSPAENSSLLDEDSAANPVEKQEVAPDGNIDFSSACKGSGAAISEDFFKKAHQALIAGTSTISGVKDPILQRAKPAFDAGLIKSWDDLRQYEKEGYPDAPTPEPIATLNAQLNALAAGDKPGMLLTPGESLPNALPEGIQAAEIPGRGTLLYRDDATLQAALTGQMGTALGYGIDEKPAGADQVVTARDQNGIVIQDVATDGRPEVEQAAAAVAGPNGTVETRPIEHAMVERAAELEETKLSNPDARLLDQDPANYGKTLETNQEEGNASTGQRGNISGSDSGKDSRVRGDRDRAGESLGDGLAGESREASGAREISRRIFASTPTRTRGASEDDQLWSTDVSRHRGYSGPNSGTSGSVEDSDTAEVAPQSSRKSTELPGARPLVESLIKRRAAAKQGGKDLSTAIARAKEVMEGKREPSTVENRWFRLQAKAFERADVESANILRQIAEVVKAKGSSSVDAPRFSRAPNKQDEFVKSPDGSLDFGQITKEIAGKIKREAAPIRLSHGVQNSDGTGYGLVHIEANHGKIIRSLGFESVEAFIAHIAKNFNSILHASGRQLLVAVKNDRQDVMYVRLEPSENGEYYRINSAFPASRGYLERQAKKGGKILWSGSEPTLAVTGQQPAYAANNPDEHNSSQADPTARGQSDSNIPENDPKFNRSRAAEVRQRLKSAPDKAKQATPPGGLSLSTVERLIAPLQAAGFKKINIAASENDLPQTAKEQIKSRNAQGVRGVYLPKTDEIWLVAGQLNDASETIMVSMHEARHRGLRKLFGPGISPIMRQIYATNKRVRDAADAMMKSTKGVSKEEATEEVLADMSINRTAHLLNGWKKLVRFIQQWLVDHGINLTFSDAMVETLVAGAEVAGMAEKDVSLFDDKQSAAYAEASEGAAFSRSPQGSLNLQGGQTGNNASWDAPDPSKIDDIIYKLQNKHVDLKRVMEAVRNTGAQLADKWNTYLQEELFHGRAAKRTQDFVNKELKPIIAGMKLRGLTVDALDKYLHARHAEEANDLIAQRDPNMSDGGSGMTNQEAKDYFANLPAEKKRKLEQVASKVDAVIAETRNLYVSYGLVDKDTADGWSTMFQHYVPLMREDHDGGMGVGQGFSIKGKEVKHRTGSRKSVVDILANIALQREKVIVRGEKNRVAVSLAGLAKLNPNPDFWTFDKVPTERVLNEKTGLVEERPDPTFKSKDNVVVAKIKDSKGKVQERAVVFNEHDERAMRMAQALKNLDATQLDGLLGVSAKITRYFASINTQYNPVFGIVNLTRDLQASLLNLSSTPIAGHKAQVLKNVLPAIRAIYSSTRGDRKGKQAASPMAALWDEMQQEGGMTGYRDLFKTSEDRANAIKRELDPTAWMNSGLGKIFTAGGALKVPLAIAQKRAGWLFDWLSDYNQTLEGAMRLSVYKTAIDNGVSKQRAASLAKNISVNFNRKGQSGQQAGALYAFFNAAMQGTARIGETMTTMEKGDIKTFRFNRAGKRIIAGGITLGAMQALALAAAGFDDDEPPEFVRERSLIFPIGDKKYITVPMPLGFHAIPNVGRISTEFALGGFKDPAKHIARLLAVFAEAFNPIGSAGLSIQTIAPTAIDPFVALSENTDWTGKPIAKEDFNKLSPTPGFSRNKDTASSPAKWIAEAINTLSGGNKYVPGIVSPTADQIDYLFGQVTGGVGRESGKAQQTASALLSGEELPPHKIPLVGRFYGTSENQSSQGNAFYSNLKRINEVEAELKGRQKDRLPIDEFKIENPEYRLVVRANLVERLVSKQRKLKSELIEKDAPKEQVKAIDERITNLMAGFNQRVKDLREEAR